MVACFCNLGSQRKIATTFEARLGHSVIPCSVRLKQNLGRPLCRADDTDTAFYKIAWFSH